MKLKHLSLLWLFLLVTGCFSSTASQSSQADSKPKISPEKTLAMLDGKKEPGTEAPYAELLDQLQSICYEDRETIAVMVFSLAKKDQEAGFEPDHKELLMLKN